MVDLKALHQSFAARYGNRPRIFSAPGRVNLIGEHTDYNDGFVLPIAINLRTYVACSPRSDRQLHVHSNNLNESGTLDLDNPAGSAQDGWPSYVFGVAQVLQRERVSLSGADMLIESDVPLGSGLSSSAALEVAVGAALLGISDVEIDPLELALACQKAEHEFVGTKCGIMDQLTAVRAHPDHALLIDCRLLEVKQIHISAPDTAFVVCNTKVKHELASSAYNQRRAECDESVAILKKRLPSITALRDVTVDDLKKHESDLPEPLRRRSRHVITENGRTLAAAEALKRGEVDVLGRLMRVSHESLRDDYEVSCVELDTMAELAWSHEAVFGARMTGGGFGGCTINLVRRDGLDAFCNFIQCEYRKRTGVQPETYLVETSGAVQEA